MNKQPTTFFLLTLALIAAIFFIRQGHVGSDDARNQAAIGGHFSLTDQHGQKRTDKDFAGKYMLVYFGYTFCPDICPTDVGALSKALKLLKNDADKIAAIFVSVDPERDTVESLAKYMENFDPRMIALTGTQAEIDEAKSAYKVYSAKAEAKDSAAEYLVDHSAFIYLMDREGNYITHFAHGTDAKIISDRIKQLAK